MSKTSKYPVGGFTLIELLVVVLIIGILAAIALPQYRKAVEKSRVASALTTLGSLRKAVDFYVLLNGYPAEPTELIGHNGSVNILDIDAESVLDCSVLSGNACKSEYFAFDADCNSNRCQISAFRCLKEDCSDFLQHYGIYTVLYKSGNNWITDCSHYDDWGGEVCNILNL